MAGIVKPLIPTAGKGFTSPADALQFGVHTSLAASSKHKKMVSAVLHLKKESVGSKAHPTAYKNGGKAFKPPHLKVPHG